MRCVATIAAGLLVIASSALAADDRATAKAHFERAERAYKLARFDEALVDYQRAYETLPLPDLLFNIGQCHRNLGNLDEAIFSFEAFLRDARVVDDRDRVTKLINDLRAEQRRRATPTTTATRTATLVAPRPAPPPRQPARLTDKWWFWPVVALGAVAVVGTTVGVVAASKPADLEGSLGTIRF